LSSFNERDLLTLSKAILCRKHERPRSRRILLTDLSIWDAHVTNSPCKNKKNTEEERKGKNEHTDNDGNTGERDASVSF
jgi:hypothetical protein